MGDGWRAFERDEAEIDRRWQEGLLSDDERNHELRELSRDYRAAAEEAAEDAYRNELELW